MIYISDYAPDPKKQQVYENLQNKTLSNVSASDIQRLTDPTFIQATNQDALLTYNTVNQAAMRDGNPMPTTATIKLAQVTDSGVSVDVFTPAKGEIWCLQSGTATVTGQSGNVVHELLWTDNTNSRSLIWYYMQSGNSIQILSDDTNWLGDKYFDENITLSYEATGTLTNSVLAILLFRVR